MSAQNDKERGTEDKALEYAMNECYRAGSERDIYYPAYARYGYMKRARMAAKKQEDESRK